MSWLRRHVFLLYCTVIAAMVVLSYWQPAPSPPLNVDATPAVLGELREVVSNVYEPDGRWRYQSRSAAMKHLRDGDVLTLEPVAIHYYSEGGQTVLLRSEFGKLLDKGKRIDLSGEVELERFGDDDGARETAHTSDVEVRMDRELAVTQAAVTIRRGGQLTSGRGMVADLRRGEISLLREVKVSRE